MIVTCTPNPSLDRTVEVRTLQRGAVQRVDAASVHPGGKGINVARVLHRNGHDAHAVAPVGGPEGDHFAALLAATDLPFTGTPLDGAIRVNIAVVEADGTTTKLNDAGAALTDETRASLLDTTLDSVHDGGWVAGCGSLPPGAGDGFYAELVKRARSTDVRVAVDTSGPALRATVEAAPDVVKPNHHELAELVDRELSTFADAVDAAREIVAAGVATVLVSLGGDGALLVTADAVWFGESGPVDVRSTVGAGDAMLAGFLAAGGAGAEALAGGITWAAAAVGLPGTTMPTPDDLHPDAVRVATGYDPDRPLKGD